MRADVQTASDTSYINAGVQTGAAVALLMCRLKQTVRMSKRPTGGRTYGAVQLMRSHRSLDKKAQLSPSAVFNCVVVILTSAGVAVTAISKANGY